jgi:pyruvate dehydrogenase E2 component (dihydrolipoyllysine-residue acetyltransferase)
MGGGCLLLLSVDTDQGLIVPVIRVCERLTAPAIADLASLARAHRLTPDDARGGTFTISNPGSVGAYTAMEIINQPQVAILGTPVIVRRPAVVLDEHGNEAIGIRPIMTLALTLDHRAVDGAYATRAVVRIKGLLESWPAAYT